MDWRPDRTLCRCIARGELEALGSLYDRYATRLYRYLVGLLGRREDAEDVVEDVFLALVERGSEASAIRNVKAYLYAAARNRALSRLRGASSGEVGLAAAQEARASDPFGEVEVWQLLGALPPEQREVVALKVYGGLTFREIGELTGVAMDTAASRYRYAIGKLKASSPPCPPLPACSSSAWGEGENDTATEGALRRGGKDG